MARIDGATNTRQGRSSSKRSSRSSRSKGRGSGGRSRKPQQNNPKLPRGWGNAAKLTGANNARDVNQADFAPPQVPSAYQRFVDNARNPTPAFDFGAALRNAFGMREPAYGGSFNPTVQQGPPQRGGGFAGNYNPFQRYRSYNPNAGQGYQVPAISKNIAERYSDWVNNYEDSYLLPPAGFTSQDYAQNSAYGGGGWYGGGGGGGGYGGGSNYNQWLRDLLTRWNI